VAAMKSYHRPDKPAKYKYRVAPGRQIRAEEPDLLSRNLISIPGIRMRNRVDKAGVAKWPQFAGTTPSLGVYLTAPGPEGLESVGDGLRISCRQ